MSGYEEIRAKKKAERKAELDARREAQYVEHVMPIDDGRNIVVEVESNDGLPALVVCRPATSAEAAHYRAILYSDATKPGHTERRAKAGPNLAASCLLWPEADVYKKLIEEHAFVPDMIAARILSAGRARAEAEEKD